MKKKWVVIYVMIILALGVVGCDRLPGAAAVQPTGTPVVPLVVEDSSVIVEGNIVPRDSTIIAARSGGMVEEVLVKKGDVVAKDAVIIRLGDREQAEAALAAAKLEQTGAQQALDTLNDKAAIATAQASAALLAASDTLIEAQQRLADFDNADYTTNLDNARTDVENARDDLKDAQETWDKNKNLDPDNANYKSAENGLEDAQKKFDDAQRAVERLENQLKARQADVAAAQAAYDDAQREYDARKDGPDPDDLALAQARLDNARAQVAAAQAALDNLDIRAPFAGTVVDLDLVAGEALIPGQQVAVIADLSEWYVDTSDLTEMDVVTVETGQQATIRPDALPELELTATVTEIARRSGTKGGDVTYTVRLKLDESDPALRWGMTVEVRFQ